MMLIVVVMVVFLGEELPLSCFSFRLFTVVICQLLLLLFVVWFGLLLLTLPVVYQGLPRSMVRPEGAMFVMSLFENS